MSNSKSAGFGAFVPGFDFLQNLAKGATQSVPGMSNWVAPTLNAEDIDKRISELKAVHFWLDQNTKALAATIQALEVQKMTLAALKGMNLSMTEIAKAFKVQPPPADAPAPTAAPAPASAEPETPPEPPPAKAEAAKPGKPAAAPAGAGMIDPMLMWSALTQQFQHIAADAMKHASQAAKAPSGVKAQKPAAKTADAAKPAAKKPGAKKAPAKKAAKPPAARKAPARRTA